MTALLAWAHALRARDTDGDERVTHFKEYWDSIGDPPLRAEIENVLAGLETIRRSVLAVNPQSSVVFDPILVRGMDYYTGPIYEAVVESFSSSILGGGRYDGLIGTFAGVASAPIRFAREGVKWSVTASNMVDMSAEGAMGIIVNAPPPAEHYDYERRDADVIMHEVVHGERNADAEAWHFEGARGVSD